MRATKQAAKQYRGAQGRTGPQNGLSHDPDAAHKQTWDANATMSRKQLTAAVMKLVDLVDGWLTFTAFEFVTWGNSNEVNFRFPEKWPDEEWIKTLEPSYSFDLQRIDQELELLKNATTHDAMAARAVINLSWDVESVKLENRRQGFNLGILVGAKMMGASRQRLEELARNWVDIVFAQPRFDNRIQDKLTP